MQILWGIGGMAAVLLIAVLLSTDRRKIKVRTVAVALALQVGLGVFVLLVPWGQRVLEAMSNAVRAVIESSEAGIHFVFGGVLPEDGNVFAFQVLPIIIFFASLTAVLYHLGVLQFVVKVIGGGLSRLLGTTRPESMNAAANIFVGQTEAPLVIRPYIAKMTRSELFAVMVGGLATVAGSVLVGYVALGANLEYLIAASFMAAPGALLMAKIMVPAGAMDDAEDDTDAAADASADADDGADRRRDSTREPAAAGGSESGGVRYHRNPGDAVPGRGPGLIGPRRRPNGPDSEVDEAEEAAGLDVDEEEPPRNVIDAAARGASDGLSLALNVGAMLIAFISLIALTNLLLGHIGDWFGAEDLSIQQILGYIFSPIVTAVGVPWAEAQQAGSFLGQKVILNEFVAFSEFAPVADELSPKTVAVVTFALTGFANLGSLAILLGGLGGIAKNQRSRIAQLGIRAVIAANLANLMSAAIAGMVIAS